MHLSVLVTTYNATEWLQKLLWGFAAQTHREFELIIADDGSRPETADLLKQQGRELGLDIKHVWQPDDGFQKCRILNKAILHARHEYLVFTDGDCIPRADFLEVHARRAAPDTYLSGSYYKLPMSTSERITRNDIESGRCFDWRWLREHGLPRSAKRSKIDAGPTMARWLNRLTPTKCNLKGSNASAWLKDIITVNGFDERMRYGGLDREFGVRLVNAGVRPVHVRYDAIVVHLDHARGYRNPQEVAANKALRVAVDRQGLVQTPNGISQLLDQGFDIPDDAAANKYLTLESKTA